MKPLVRLTLKARALQDPETLIPIGVLDINTAGDSVCILDRDEMGAIHIDSSETLGDVDWCDVIDELVESTRWLQSKALELEQASRGMQSALQGLRRVMVDRATKNEG